jgi:hypothetical protein
MNTNIHALGEFQTHERIILAEKGRPPRLLATVSGSTGERRSAGSFIIENKMAIY